MVERVRNGESQAKVCRETGIPESTLRGWIKQEDQLRTFVAELDGEQGLARKRARQAQNPQLDKAVFNWFTERRAEGVPISGPIIQAKAAQMNKLLGGSTEFKCSIGWLNRW